MKQNDDEGWTLVTKKKPDQKEKKSKYQGPLQETYEEGSHYPSFGGNNNRFQDWNEIQIQKRPPKTTKRVPHQTIYSNEQRHLAKIESDENYVPKKVKPELSRKIQSYRQKHQLTQIDLARKINEKPDIVSSYEKGTAIHDPRITSKFYRLFTLL